MRFTYLAKRCVTNQITGRIVYMASWRAFPSFVFNAAFPFPPGYFYFTFCRTFLHFKPSFEGKHNKKTEENKLSRKAFGKFKLFAARSTREMFVKICFWIKHKPFSGVCTILGYITYVQAKNSSVNIFNKTLTSLRFISICWRSPRRRGKRGVANVNDFPAKSIHWSPVFFFLLS